MAWRELQKTGIRPGEAARQAICRPPPALKLASDPIVACDGEPFLHPIAVWWSGSEHPDRDFETFKTRETWQL